MEKCSKYKAFQSYPQSAKSYVLIVKSYVLIVLRLRFDSFGFFTKGRKSYVLIVLKFKATYLENM